MGNEIRKAWAGRHDMIVVDRKADLAFFALWLIYTTWGFTSTVVHTTILGTPALAAYPTIWGATIGLFGAAACASIIASFFTAADQFRERIKQYKIEAWALFGMGGFIAVHPILSILRLLTQDPPRPDTAVLAFSYLVMIAYRIHMQLQRAATVRTADLLYQEEHREEDQ